MTALVSAVCSIVAVSFVARIYSIIYSPRVETDRLWWLRSHCLHNRHSIVSPSAAILSRATRWVMTTVNETFVILQNRVQIVPGDSGLASSKIWRRVGRLNVVKIYVSLSEDRRSTHCKKKKRRERIFLPDRYVRPSLPPSRALSAPLICLRNGHRGKKYLSFSCIILVALSPSFSSLSVSPPLSFSIFPCPSSLLVTSCDRKIIIATHAALQR